MKAIHARGRPIHALLLLSSAMFVLCLLRLSEGTWAAWLTVGGAGVAAQIGGEPERWRTRSGSLFPAMFLVAICWFAAGFAAAMALFQRR